MPSEMVWVLFWARVAQEELDMFLSHTWETPGRWKFLSLLLQRGWPFLLVAWAAGASLPLGL